MPAGKAVRSRRMLGTIWPWLTESPKGWPEAPPAERVRESRCVDADSAYLEGVPIDLEPGYSNVHYYCDK